MPNIAYFFLALLALFLGYAVYSRVIERLFGADYDRPTPAETMADGVDYVKMPTWRVFMIQLLNIAGVGPVFGPIMGALYGPAALFWIVLGGIFAGAVHDYFSGMMSVRYNGKSIPEVVGIALGPYCKALMRVFAIVLLVLVGTVFVTAPAGLLDKLTPPSMGLTFWVVVIFAYYLVATVLPINVLIGRLYPLFAIVLLIMAFGVAGGLICEGYSFYQWEIPEGMSIFSNFHPKADTLPIWPMVFLTISCSALSGFHSTQSPLMSRCVKSEREGRAIFYGAMIAESVIGLIWATAGMTFYPTVQALAGAGGGAGVVFEVCKTLLGPVGGVLAILGVVALPVTSGDTAFRAARLVIGDITNIDQKKAGNRLAIAIPMFVIGGVLSQIDFNIIWRYFTCSNQALASLMLWTGAAYVVRRGGCHWLLTVPATFMTATVVTYICMAPEGFTMAFGISRIIGIVFAAAVLALFLSKRQWFEKNVPLELKPEAGGK